MGLDIEQCKSQMCHKSQVTWPPCSVVQESIPKGEVLASVTCAGAVQCPCCPVGPLSALELFHTPWLKNTHF